MSLTYSFGTDDVIYVPPDGRLRFFEVYSWTEYTFDVRRFNVRLTPDAFEKVKLYTTEAVDLLSNSSEWKERMPKIEAFLSEAMKGLALESTTFDGGYYELFSAETQIPGSQIWVKLTDVPAESFQHADYSETGDIPQRLESVKSFGSLIFNQLEFLEVTLPQQDNLSPVSIDVPEESGMESAFIDPMKPLPLVTGFCGARGASGVGETVNLNSEARVEQDHKFATPVRVLQGGLYATLYFYIPTQPDFRVIERLDGIDPFDFFQFLKEKGYEVMGEGESWCILKQSENIIHLYDRLPGKETEGFNEMPSFLLAAQANGSFDPKLREELVSGIKSDYLGSKESHEQP